MMYPYEVLGVPETTDDAEVRKAYLRKVREFPPERAEREFQEIAHAYELLKDTESRARLRVFGVPLDNDGDDIALACLLPKPQTTRRRVGIDVWIDVLEGRLAAKRNA